MPEYPIHVSSCWFVDGQHVFAGPNCPHDATVDEEGPVIPRGWTAQQ